MGMTRLPIFTRHSMIAIEGIPELIEARGMRFRKKLEAQRLSILNVGDRGRTYNR
jgi:hypothetical protein